MGERERGEEWKGEREKEVGRRESTLHQKTFPLLTDGRQRHEIQGFFFGEPCGRGFHLQQISLQVLLLQFLQLLQKVILGGRGGGEDLYKNGIRLCCDD